VVELQTERLILREYGPDDFYAVHAYASDPRVAKFVEWGPNQPQDTREFLDACLRDQRTLPRTTYTLALTEAGGAPFGSVALFARRADAAAMGYVVRPDHWSQGYASEAAAAILHYAFSTLGLHRVQATCRPENLASARVLEKIGMVREDLLRDHIQIRGQWHDSLLYAATWTRPESPIAL
jgi:[ribosomal protein S5]-alanine N-acetyltransferase